ncbi:MAG: LacI family transcriptional regulator [Bifidobacterium sp.]|jgi:LacI family transcriptional regulator|nr:LacI family transcriptional regulator [Bifidobacterium sp.]
MVTIKDLSQLAKVSPTTVSNVLHGHTNKVSPETLKRVRRAIEQTHYVPNMGGRLLAKHGSRIIGVITTYARRTELIATSSPYYSEIIGSLENEIRMSGYYMMLYTSADIDESMGLAQTWDVEGLVVLGSSEHDAETFFQEVKVPVMFIDTYGSGIPNVGVDDRNAMRTLVEHLIALGHRRIAFLTDSTVSEGIDRARYQGYADALERYGIAVSPDDVITISYQDSVRRRELHDLYRAGFNGYTALCFPSDLYAIDAIGCLTPEGVRIPEDISITGFDGNYLAYLSLPRLTTVSQDLDLKGKIAVESLMKQIKAGEQQPVHIELPTYLVTGGSAGAAAAPNQSSVTD